MSNIAKELSWHTLHPVTLTYISRSSDFETPPSTKFLQDPMYIQVDRPCYTFHCAHTCIPGYWFYLSKIGGRMLKQTNLTLDPVSFSRVSVENELINTCALVVGQTI